jgi:hypothetical protein
MLGGLGRYATQLASAGAGLLAGRYLKRGGDRAVNTVEGAALGSITGNILEDLAGAKMIVQYGRICQKK